MRKAAVREKIRIPILMYHSISDGKEDGVNWYYRINTSPRVFSEHMRYLYEENFVTVGLSAVVAHLACSRVSPENKVVALTCLFRRIPATDSD
jgi:hypothetical protein